MTHQQAAALEVWSRKDAGTTDAAVSPDPDPGTAETEAFDYEATDEDQVGEVNNLADEAVTYHVGGDDAGVFNID